MPTVPASKQAIKKQTALPDKRRQLRLAISETLVTGCKPVPSGDWGVISIDPPWHYELRDGDQSHRGRTPYPAMTDQQILDLPIGQVAADDSYCLLWTTSNHIELAHQCLRQWGFEPTGGILVWIKATKATESEDDLSGVRFRIGCGNYLRNCHEYLIIGRRGKIKAWSTYGIRDIPSVLVEAPTRHSRKPDKFYEIAERLRSSIGCQAIDLFAREKRVDSPEWSIWGAESEVCLS